MKVIKEGRKQQGFSLEKECTGKGNGGGGCGAVLLVEGPDFFHTYSSCMGRDEEWYITFKCPSCGVLTDVDRKEVPFTPRSLPSKREWESQNENWA